MKNNEVAWLVIFCIVMMLVTLAGAWLDMHYNQAKPPVIVIPNQVQATISAPSLPPIDHANRDKP